MFEITLTFLAAMAKTFSIASALNLPLNRCRDVMFSSESMLILMLFAFVVGETKSIIPALIVVIFYIYVEVIPTRLYLQDKYFFEEYEKA